MNIYFDNLCNCFCVCMLKRIISLNSNSFLKPISFHPIHFTSSKSIDIWISHVWSAGENPFLWQEIWDPHWASICARVCARVPVPVRDQWNTTQGVWGQSISSSGCWWHSVSLSYRLMTLKSSLTSSWHQVLIGWQREGWWIDEWPDRWMCSWRWN